MEPDGLAQLKLAIVDLDRSRALELASQLLGEHEPMQIVESALRPGLEEVGKEFERGRVFLPELVLAGMIATEIGDLLQESLAATEDSSSRWSIALGTVKGDCHVIGKNIVAVMLRAHGFDVHDLGADVATEDFVRIAKDVDAVGLSALLTTVTKNVRDIVEAVSSEHPDTVIIAGGAALSPVLADALGVLYGPDAASGVKLLVDNLEARQSSPLSR